MLAKPEPVGRVVFAEPEMAEMADSPAGWRRDDAYALESYKGGAVQDKNKQARSPRPRAPSRRPSGRRMEPIRVRPISVHAVAL